MEHSTQLHPGIDPEFAVNAANMGVHRAGGNLEIDRDLFIGITAGQQAQDLGFALRQGRQQFLRGPGCVGLCGAG